jgi:carbon monoxide dehydrogenase subunit G
VTIDSPISRVFAYMDDVSRESEWQPGIREASKEPPGETTVGTKKRYVSEFMGRRIENVYVTRAFVPNEYVSYETSPDSVLRAKVDLRFEPTGSGTRVTMAVAGKVTGVLKFLPNSVLEGVFRKELETSLGLLKDRLEGGA